MGSLISSGDQLAQDFVLAVHHFDDGWSIRFPQQRGEIAQQHATQDVVSRITSKDNRAGRNDMQAENKTTSPTSVHPVVMPPDCIRKLSEAGWVFHYDDSTKHIGADHPLGGKQSILKIDCPSRNGFEANDIGQKIVDWFRSA